MRLNIHNWFKRSKACTSFLVQPLGQRDPAADGLVEDPAEKGRVVGNVELVALTVADVLLLPSPRQNVDVGHVDLASHRDDEELDTGIRDLADSPLQEGLGDSLRPAVREQHQLPPGSGRVAAARQRANGELQGLQNVGAFVLELGCFDFRRQQGVVVGQRILKAGVSLAVLAHGHSDTDACLSLCGEETFGQELDEGLAYVKVILAHTG